VHPLHVGVQHRRHCSTVRRPALVGLGFEVGVLLLGGPQLLLDFVEFPAAFAFLGFEGGNDVLDVRLVRRGLLAFVF